MGQTKNKRPWQWGWLGSLGMAWVALTLSPAAAAERLLAQYSFLQLSIPVTELEAFAKDGTLGPTLTNYASYLEPQQVEQLRATLQLQIPVDPQLLERLLTTPVGENLLQRLSQVLQSQSQGADVKALRQGLLLAAADPEGLTPVSLMRHFPDAGLYVDVDTGIQMVQAVETLVQETERAIATIRQRSQPSASPISPSALTRIQQPGPFPWQTSKWTWTDRSAKRLQLTGQARRVPVDIYFPRQVAKQQHPVIVVSHGFASDRNIYVYLAQHLASHGYVVVVPEHVGSSAKQIKAWQNGKAPEASSPREFIDRPLDITFVLDRLAGITDQRLQGHMDLEQVGVIGHSFGGYTALAVAGAPLNRQALAQDCAQRPTTLNLSLLLQCEFLELPNAPASLADPRVKAVLAVNPIGRSLFGQTGLRDLRRPVMIVTGGADLVTPSLLEQIQPFTWLAAPDKYLVMIEKASHFSTIGAVPKESEVFNFPPALVGPTPDVARNYLKGLGLTFFQNHLRTPNAAPPLAQVAQVQQLSQPSLPLWVLQQLSAADLPPQQRAASIR